MACRLATWPTRRSPDFENATTDGVVRLPSALGMTTGSPPSMTATHEFVVPRSIPMILLMLLLLSPCLGGRTIGYEPIYVNYFVDVSKSSRLRFCGYSTTSTLGFSVGSCWREGAGRSSETGARLLSSERSRSIWP